MKLPRFYFQAENQVFGGILKTYNFAYRIFEGSIVEVSILTVKKMNVSAVFLKCPSFPPPLHPAMKLGDEDCLYRANIGKLGETRGKGRFGVVEKYPSYYRNL